ncbi:MAG: phasin family protein [Hyphomicrobiales bacterium]|nr:phasin family protein [Hyphomicrobiales bacterium]MCP5372327.1 phasin family protein [Hyphomicrobiales bacterium]
MATNKNPFLNFDMTQMLADFDPKKMAAEFSKVMGQYNLPSVDVESMLKSQQKNVEALTVANRTAMEGFQAVANRQAEILKETLDEAQAAVERFATSTTPQDAAAKQAELVKDAFEKALSNMRELAELVAKSNNEAASAINSRISESLEEIKSLALDMKK